MKAKEVIQHRRETSMSSVPSSPRSINPIHGRHASTDSTDFKEIALLPRKPMPNYLRPTISSAHNAPPTKSLVRRRSTDKLTSPPLPHQPLRARGSNASEKTPKAAPSSKALASGKSLKTNKSGMMTLVSSKATRAPKKATPVEKVLCIDNGSGPARVKDEEDHSAQTDTKAIRSSSNYFSPRKVAKQAARNTEDDDYVDEHYEASGESLAGGEEGDIGRARVRKVKSLPVDSINEGSPRRLNIRQEREKEEENEKETPLVYNEVIEETTSKLAGMRRNKVAALVGAFETVISLQEAAEDEVKLNEGGDERVDDMAVTTNEEAVVDKADEERGNGEEEVVEEGAKAKEEESVGDNQDIIKPVD